MAVQLVIGDVRLAVIAATALLAVQDDEAALVLTTTLVSLPVVWLLRRPRPAIDARPVLSWLLTTLDLLVAVLVLAAAGIDSLALVYAAMTCALAGLRLGYAGAVAAFLGVALVHGWALFGSGVEADVVIVVLARLGLLAVAGMATVRLRELLLSRELLAAQVRVLEADGIRDQERRRLARDMHDSLAKTLHGSVLLGRRLARRLESAGHPDAADAGVVVQALNHAQDEARALLANLRDDNRGTLAQRLEQLALRWEAETGRVLRRSLADRSEAASQLSAEARDELVRAAAELLENVHRHAGQGAAELRFSDDGEQIRVEVSDEGCGMTEPDLTDLSRGGHYGLVGVHERMRRVGGRVLVRIAHPERTTGRGTRVELVAPLQRLIDLDAVESSRGVLPTVATAWGG